MVTLAVDGECRVHGGGNRFRYRRRSGSRRVRPHPAPGGRVLGGGRTHLRRCGIRRRRGGQAFLIMGFNPLSFFDVGIWRDDHSFVARASVVCDGAGNFGAGGDRPAQRQRCGPGWSECSSPCCYWSGRFGCRGRTHRGRVGAITNGPKDASCTRTRALYAQARSQAKLWLQDVVAGEPRFPDDDAVNAELDREIHAAPACGVPMPSSRPTPVWRDRDRSRQCATSTTPNSSTTVASST